ncbi:MAG: hypothetical protein ACJ76S_02160 [Solirubrobacteraceae bacterium]|jgi:hypothetical protein
MTSHALQGSGLRRRIAVAVLASGFALGGAPVGTLPVDKAAAGKKPPGESGPVGRLPVDKAATGKKSATAGGGTMGTYGRKIRR